MTRKEADAGGYETGQVKWYNGDKGYGFIVPDRQGPDVFVHATTAARHGIKPVEGMKLAFKARRGPKGMVADEIEILTGGA
jgi:CspA family cold shock protein